jgi:hypothetical protein
LYKKSIDLCIDLMPRNLAELISLFVIIFGGVLKIFYKQNLQTDTVSLSLNV